MVGSPIVLVNRIGEPLYFTADGQHFKLEPGENYGFVEPHAKFAMAQNPLMGSEDYNTLEFESLVGVKGQTPCEPFSDKDLKKAAEAVDRFNREQSGLRPGVKVQSKYRVPKGRMGGDMTTNASEKVFATGRG